jgi:hypothetical protein
MRQQLAKLSTMKPDQPKRPLWLQLLGLAFLAHLLFCVQRIATKALPGRIDEITAWREMGPIEFHMGDFPETVRAVQFLVDHTPPDALILRKGTTRGLIEHTAALLRPRLLYDLASADPNATHAHGRPFARASLPDLGEGTLVLVAVDTNTLRLELR